MSHYKVLVIGGYGNFGKRICEYLAREPSVQLFVGGRNLASGKLLCSQLRRVQPALTTEAVVLDIDNPRLGEQLCQTGPDLVIHTSGPYQQQSYQVAKACLQAKAHYIDLSDDRRFVCDITQLNQQAADNGVLLVSGASSVPGLSSTVIDHYLPQFKRLDTIKYAIAPGNRIQRGLATVKAILSYTGHPFTTWRNSRWQQIYGWMDSTVFDFGAPVGKRRLANINIPDLELFPNRYQPVKTISFKAGLELSPMHNFMVFMAWLAKKKIVKSWARCAKFSLLVSNWFYRAGTDIGGMVVTLCGIDQHGQQKKLKWTLVAEHGCGPYIPTIPAVLVAKRLIRQSIDVRGAMPCLGLFTLEEFMSVAKDMGIYSYEQNI